MKRSKFSWKKLFGSKNSNSIPKPNSQDKNQQVNTLEKLREMEDLLRRKQSHLETKIQDEINEARKQGMKNKRAALLALKRKKRLESELTRLDGTLTTIELQREAVESAKNNLQVLGAMKDAANILKTAQKHITVDKVLDIMDDVNEQQEIANEIAEAIANPLGSSANAIDDEELEKELEELEQEELNKALLNITSTALPEANGKKVSDLDALIGSNLKAAASASDQNQKIEKVDPDEKELQELAQWSM